MTVIEHIYQKKGTVVRLTFHSRSGATFKVNPLMFGAAGFTRNLRPDNGLLPFKSTLAEFHEGTIVFLNDDANQVDVLRIELRERIIGLTPLVLYPDGSTWEGLVGTDFSQVRAMVWSPELAKRIPNPATPLPWGPDDDWKAVPTSLLVGMDHMMPACAQIEHSCCEPCK